MRAAPLSGSVQPYRSTTRVLEGGVPPWVRGGEEEDGGEGDPIREADVICYVFEATVGEVTPPPTEEAPEPEPVLVRTYPKYKVGGRRVPVLPANE